MNPDDPIFRQVVNVWRFDQTLRDLTTHSLLARYATELADISLRLWHDQLLTKKPHNGAATSITRTHRTGRTMTVGTACPPGSPWSMSP